MVAIQDRRRGRPGLAQLEPSDREPLRRLFYRLRRVGPSARLALSYGVYETTVPIAAFRTATEPSASAAADHERL
jgi:hypothetical protein